MKKIAPSILSADFTRLGDEIGAVTAAGADYIHIDVMDGHFVPNLTFGPEVVRALRGLTRIPFDVHLMCDYPELLLEPFAAAGASLITIHVELGDQVTPLLWKVRSLGLPVGLAINPPTAMSAVEPHLKQIDMLLVMTVNPGYGGQPFIEEMLPKIQQADDWRRHLKYKYRLEVDGGINYTTAADCAGGGADTFVSGSTLFHHRNMRLAIKKLRAAVSALTRSSRLAAVGMAGTS
jgi:ribulose-phosphate 3-epimerase